MGAPNKTLISDTVKDRQKLIRAVCYGCSIGFTGDVPWAPPLSPSSGHSGYKLYIHPPPLISNQKPSTFSPLLRYNTIKIDDFINFPLYKK